MTQRESWIRTPLSARLSDAHRVARGHPLVRVDHSRDVNTDTVFNADELPRRRAQRAGTGGIVQQRGDRLGPRRRVRLRDEVRSPPVLQVAEDGIRGGDDGEPRRHRVDRQASELAQRLGNDEQVGPQRQLPVPFEQGRQREARFEAQLANERPDVRAACGVRVAEDHEIIYVRGTTEGINLVAQTYGRQNVGPGDEIIISTMEHHSNIVPWQILCEEKGAKLKIIPINDAGELLIDEYEKLLGPRTKLVSIVHQSNALGTINPVEAII